MDMWDNITEKVGKAAKTVGKEAVKLADAAKTKYNIAVREGKLEKLFESIGALHYDQLTSENDNSEKIANLVEEVDAIILELALLRSERAPEPEAKEPQAVKCAGCGTELHDGAAFCHKCGTAV